MKKERFGFLSVVKPAVALALCAAILAFFFLSVQNLNEGRQREGRDQLESALRRAAVSCYAAEGVYPPTLEYLEEHYGLQIDRSQYAVFYSVFADNMMPDIVVLEGNNEEDFDS